MLNRISEIDCQMMKTLSTLRFKAADFFFIFLTYSAVGPVWFGLAFLLNFLEQKGVQVLPQQKILLKCLFAPLVTWIVGHLIKRAVRRKRPFQHIPNFLAGVRSPIDDSFPSLHAGSTFAFFTALSTLDHPWSPAIGLWAIMTSFSRIYLGVHFVSDVLAGMLLGSAFGCSIGLIADFISSVSAF